MLEFASAFVSSGASARRWARRAALAVGLSMACSTGATEAEAEPAAAPAPEAEPERSPEPVAQQPDDDPAPEPPPSELSAKELTAPPFGADMHERACELLEPEAIARVAGIAVSEVEASDLNRDYGVRTECRFTWGDPIREYARVYEIEVDDTIEDARRAWEEAIASTHPKVDLRPLAGIGDEAMFNTASWRRHTKDPKGERSGRANQVWLRVANLRLKVTVRNGPMDRSFETEVVALAKEVAARVDALRAR